MTSTEYREVLDNYSMIQVMAYYAEAIGHCTEEDAAMVSHCSVEIYRREKAPIMEAFLWNMAQEKRIWEILSGK